MPGLSRAAIMALALFGGAASAQTASETTTTSSTTYPAMQAPPYPVAAPRLVAPPPGTLATIHTTRSIDAYGNEVDQQKATYRNSQGVAQDSRTVTRIIPAPPPVTTTTTTTTQQTTDTPN